LAPLIAGSNEPIASYLISARRKPPSLMQVCVDRIDVIESLQSNDAIREMKNFR
jgi:hypothetical protein